MSYKIATFGAKAPTTLEKSIDFGVALVSFEPPNLIRLQIKNGETFGMEHVQRVRDWAMKHTGGNRYKLLSSPEPQANVSSELREYLSHPDRLKYALADALVVSNFAHRLLADFYLKFSRPILPTRTFPSEEAAREWLETI